MKEEYKLYLVYGLLIILIVLLASCTTKSYVITEYDGERVIRWYSR